MGGGASTRHKDEKQAQPAAEKEKQKKKEEIDERSLDEIVCRLMQVHHAQSRDRWERATRKINSAMRRRKIPAQPIKEAIRREDAEIPGCWIAEMEERRRQRQAAALKVAELERQRAEAEKSPKRNPPKSPLRRFLRAPAAEPPPPVAALPPALSESDVIGDGGMAGRTGSDATEGDEASESETEAEVDGNGARGSGGNGKYIYVPLTKHEVFAMHRRLHHAVGDSLLASDDGRGWVAAAVTPVVDTLFEGQAAKMLRDRSQRGRLAAGMLDDSLAYGELDVHAFVSLLHKARYVHGHLSASGGAFYDLGAGAGKLVLAAALAHEFKVCRGIELVGDLLEVARAAAQEYARKVVPALLPTQPRSPVDMTRGDFLLQDAWAYEATVLLVHANLGPAAMAEVRRKADNCRPGALCFSVSVSAVSPEKWGLLAVEVVPASWGPATVFVHEKMV